ncbi:tetratricopeptide repeat protein [Pontiella sulfatireligans]|uniref:Uncharacterized protein n=1 Tax=Pontiella sulfatireligans TaxID=2750658 RepID=A0A6C2UR02_9BACT|nr:hypothetical protein [Pontiella sulfatireligans]VGO22658.1 hypothetical protein SCARR_04753 [Pontiella sulfatireligans]
MKNVVAIIALVAVSAIAQEEVVQSGTPARLEAVNGKQVRVFLQSLVDGTVTFQAFKSDKNIPVPADKIRRFEFYPKYDAAALEQSFNSADYDAVLATLEPLMLDYAPYMTVSNNMQDAYCMMMEAYRAQGDFAKVRVCAEALAQSSGPKFVMLGQVNTALAAIAEGDFKAVESLREEIESEAASLYLQASAERAQGQPKVAMQTVVEIIAEHANDVQWMAPSELLSAELYLDMAMTNSAVSTARQVKNIYGGSNIAADANKLYIALGGESE